MERVLSPMWARTKDTRGKAWHPRRLQTETNSGCLGSRQILTQYTILIDLCQVTCKHQGSTVDRNLCVPSEKPDEQVCWAHTATTSLIVLLTFGRISLIPDAQCLASDTQCPQVSCLLSACALSVRDAEVLCQTGEGSPRQYLAPTIPVRRKTHWRTRM